MSDEESNPKGFKITDRRHGQSEDEASQQDAPAPKTTNSTASADGHASLGSDPSINFTSLILSLSTSAMMHMGHTENPLSKQQDEDLDVAKQEIQIIEMLQEKSQGNLNEDEEKLLGDILFHLRMKFIEKNKA